VDKPTANLPHSRDGSPQSDAVTQVSDGVWHANALSTQLSELKHIIPPQSASVAQSTATRQVPTGSPQTQMVPGPQSASVTQPYAQ
jgi:hypothetical protein